MNLVAFAAALVVITVIAAWLASNRTARRQQSTFDPQRYVAAVELAAQERAARERRIQGYVDEHMAALDIQLAPRWRVVREERSERLLTAQQN